MSEVVVTPEAASVAIDPSAAAKPVAPAPAVAAPPVEKPAWLDARLEQAKKAALSEAGFESLEAAKKASDAIKLQEEANKTEAQKRTDAEKALSKTEKQLKEAGEALSGYAKAQMGALTEAQQAAVSAVAGEDAAKQLKTIEALRPTWAGAAAPAAAVATKAPDTAHGRTAPNSAGSVAETDHKAFYETLEQSNPILAARYALVHGLFEQK